MDSGAHAVRGNDDDCSHSYWLDHLLIMGRGSLLRARLGEEWEGRGGRGPEEVIRGCGQTQAMPMRLVPNQRAETADVTV